MAWPASQDYNEALQNPQSSFRDPELCQGQVVVNALGIPQPCSGNFADVYAVECPAARGKWAVKCFTREVPRLHERYAAISRHLQNAHLPFIVDFTFLEQGIRVLGQWYPVLKMRWVEGLTLNEFVRQHADKPAMLKNLLQIWVRMAARLRESGIAHADLQHGNVLLVPGSAANSLAVKLVDYDGMFVPALAGGDSGEVGHACYQHPQRLAERTYSSEVDRFPLLLIATALESLRVGGRKLWEKYDSGDNLLFSAADLQAPVKSPLFHELLKLSDHQTLRLTRCLFDALKGRLESVPLLEEVLPELHASSVARSAATAKQTTVQAAETDSVWNFEGERKPFSRQRKSNRSRWVGGMVGVVALVLAGGIIALAFRQGPEKLKDERRIARKRADTPPQLPEKPKEKKDAKQESSHSDPPPMNDADPPVASQPKPALEVKEPAAKAASPEPVKRVENSPAPTEPQPPVTSPDIPAAKEDFTSLFNGKDLTGWKPSPNDKAKWEVKDGILIGSGPTGHLFSERGDYENFHLRMEAMINDGGKSGIYFRAAFASGFPKGYEARINSTASDPLRTGSLSGIYRVAEQLHKPDEWFQQEVIAEGGRIVIKVNGKTVVDKRDSRYKKRSFRLATARPGRRSQVRQDRNQAAGLRDVSFSRGEWRSFRSQGSRESLREILHRRAGAAARGLRQRDRTVAEKENIRRGADEINPSRPRREAAV